MTFVSHISLTILSGSNDWSLKNVSTLPGLAAVALTVGRILQEARQRPRAVRLRVTNTFLKNVESGWALLLPVGEGGAPSATDEGLQCCRIRDILFSSPASPGPGWHFSPRHRNPSSAPSGHLVPKGEGRARRRGAA